MSLWGFWVADFLFESLGNAKLLSRVFVRVWMCVFRWKAIKCRKKVLAWMGIKHSKCSSRVEMHDTRTSPVITCCAALCLICKLAKCISDCDFLQTTYTTLKKINKASGFVSLQTQQLYIKDEGGIRWDDARMAFVSVSVVRWTGQLGPLTNTHLDAGGWRGGDRNRTKAMDCYWALVLLENTVNWIIM